jgi:hypothetical protein
VPKQQPRGVGDSRESGDQPGWRPWPGSLVTGQAHALQARQDGRIRLEIDQCVRPRGEVARHGEPCLDVGLVIRPDGQHTDRDCSHQEDDEPTGQHPQTPVGTPGSLQFPGNYRSAGSQELLLHRLEFSTVFCRPLINVGQSPAAEQVGLLVGTSSAPLIPIGSRTFDVGPEP